LSKSKIIRSSDVDQSGCRTFNLKYFSEMEKHKKITPDKTPAEYTFEPLAEVGDSPAATFAKAKKALQQAQQVLAEARKEAEKIRAQAQKDKKKIIEKAQPEGFDQGYQQGFIEGQAKGKEEFKSKRIETWKFLDDIGNLYQNIMEANEAVLVKLALTVAERVLLREVSCSPEAISAAFKAAMEHLNNMHEVILRAHPDDLAQLEAARSNMTDKSNETVKITLSPDPTLNRGDLIAETEAGLIDATLKTRLKAVVAAVDEELKKNFNVDW